MTQWTDDRLSRAYEAVRAVLDEAAPEVDTHLHSALQNALSNIELSDELLANGGRAE